jgi:hypothetical protein
MARKGSSFGNFSPITQNGVLGVKPIKAEFGGSVPDSLYTVNRESAWSRWRRGFELATSFYNNNSLDYPFDYIVPVPTGIPGATGNAPTIPGVFKGFPTKNKELGMHWAGVRLAGSLRMDNITDTTGQRASIASVTEDDDFWYVQLAGSWSPSTPLPPPLFVAIPGVPGGLKAINGEILEDRIINPGDAPITRDSIDPNTQTRYGYVQAVLVDTDPFNGILKLRKKGSVEATPDRVLVSPARRPPSIGRFLTTGTRYCCSCQDFTRRDYAYLSSLGQTKRPYFPRTKVASLKPGRYEVMRVAGRIANQAMTDALTNRQMEIISPDIDYAIPPTVTPNASIVRGANRDNPGVFRDFGSIYTRTSADPSIPGSKADGIPEFNDYETRGDKIISLTDFWEPLLDEFRYCKHIYAMKYLEGVFPPEPSDFPVQMQNMAEWEQRLVAETEKEQRDAAIKLSDYAFTYMDVPPYNCQAPMMMPMMQKLFNVPSTFIIMQNFIMYDKEGNAYVPAQQGRPAT